MKNLDPVALFRLSVLGPLVARSALSHGELKETIADPMTVDQRMVELVGV